MKLQAALHQARLAALARRAETQPEAVQALLKIRLQQLGGGLPPQAPGELRAARPAAPPVVPSPSPLAVLLAEITDSAEPDRSEPANAEHGLQTLTPRAGAGDLRPPPTPSPRSHRELKAVRDYRSTWSRLAVEQRLHQALANVPSNAGPLNTQRLVHQALQTLNTLSPAYLQRLVVQGEALLWLEQLGTPPPASPGSERKAAPARATAARRERGRSG
jgi:hypothetical protein